MKLYIKYGDDGLPDAVADSPEELARMTGCKARSIKSYVAPSGQKHGNHRGKYVRIEVEEDEQETDRP